MTEQIPQDFQLQREGSETPRSQMHWAPWNVRICLVSPRASRFILAAISELYGKLVTDRPTDTPPGRHRRLLARISRTPCALPLSQSLSIPVLRAQPLQKKPVRYPVSGAIPTSTSGLTRDELRIPRLQLT